MKEYEKGIIRQFVTTALISDDPEQYLTTAIEELVDEFAEPFRSQKIDQLFEIEQDMEVITSWNSTLCLWLLSYQDCAHFQTLT